MLGGDEQGLCEACGSELFIKGFLGDDDSINWAVVCPNCDQIDMPEDAIRPDDSPDD